MKDAHLSTSRAPPTEERQMLDSNRRHSPFLVRRTGRARAVPPTRMPCGSVPARNRPACREPFRPLVDTALSGELQIWAHSDRGLIALIFCWTSSPAISIAARRSLCRRLSSPGTGPTDALRRPSPAPAAIHQVFLYLPLEHCEDLDIRRSASTLFTALAASNRHLQMPAPAATRRPTGM